MKRIRTGECQGAFLGSPEKAWKLCRALGKTIERKRPNPAHAALADLEKNGLFDGVITQNVDGLHAAAGSLKVVEVHGDHRRLQCLSCGRLEEFTPTHLEEGPVPACPGCNRPMKPNVVLFGEAVRDMHTVADLVADCDLLLVIGTSAQVYPVAEIPAMVARRGGAVYEFNLEKSAPTQFHFEGRAGETVRRFADAVIEAGRGSSS